MSTFECVDSVSRCTDHQARWLEIPKRGNDGRLTVRTFLLTLTAMGIWRFVSRGRGERNGQAALHQGQDEKVRRTADSSLLSSFQIF